MGCGRARLAELVGGAARNRTHVIDLLELDHGPAGISPLADAVDALAIVARACHVRLGVTASPCALKIPASGPSTTIATISTTSTVDNALQIAPARRASLTAVVPPPRRFGCPLQPAVAAVSHASSTAALIHAGCGLPQANPPAPSPTRLSP